MVAYESGLKLVKYGTVFAVTACEHEMKPPYQQFAGANERKSTFALEIYTGIHGHLEDNFKVPTFNRANKILLFISIFPPARK